MQYQLILGTYRKKVQSDRTQNRYCARRDEEPIVCCLTTNVPSLLTLFLYVPFLFCGSIMAHFLLPIKVTKLQNYQKEILVF